MKLQCGDYIRFAPEGPFGPLSKFSLQIFYIHKRRFRIYAEIITLTKSQLRDEAYGILMNQAGYAQFKKYTGCYWAGYENEFIFDIKENLKRNKISIAKIYGNNRLKKMLDSKNPDDKAYAEDCIMKQIFKRN